MYHLGYSFHYVSIQTVKKVIYEPSSKFCSHPNKTTAYQKAWIEFKVTNPISWPLSFRFKLYQLGNISRKHDYYFFIRKTKPRSHVTRKNHNIKKTYNYFSHICFPANLHTFYLPRSFVWRGSCPSLSTPYFFLLVAIP